MEDPGRVGCSNGKGDGLTGAVAKSQFTGARPIGDLDRGVIDLQLSGGGPIHARGAIADRDRQRLGHQRPHPAIVDHGSGTRTSDERPAVGAAP